MNEFCWLQVSSEINNALGIFHTKEKASNRDCLFPPSLRCKGSSLASALKVLDSSGAFVAGLGNWSFQWHMMWPSSLGSWGTFLSPAQLDSWARPLSAVIFSFILSFISLPIFPTVKSLIPLLQKDPSFLFPLPLHPSFSRGCRHCCSCPPLPIPGFSLPVSSMALAFFMSLCWQ